MNQTQPIDADRDPIHRQDLTMLLSAAANLEQTEEVQRLIRRARRRHVPSM